jgi:hypothetical protein
VGTRMVRAVRFELPTFWFVAIALKNINYCAWCRLATTKPSFLALKCTEALSRLQPKHTPVPTSAILSPIRRL